MPRRLIRSAVKTAGRTAVIAGTATAQSGRAMDRQPDAITPRHKHYVSGPAVLVGDRRTSHREFDVQRNRLHQLADLKAMGALTQKEFAAAKAKLLTD